MLKNNEDDGTDQEDTNMKDDEKDEEVIQVE